MKIKRRVPRKLVDSILQEGRVLHTPFFSCRYVFGGLIFSYTVTASKKISKKAVVRNKNRRRIREVVFIVAQKAIKPCLMMISINKDISATPILKLQEELEVAFKRISVL